MAGLAGFKENPALGARYRHGVTRERVMDERARADKRRAGLEALRRSIHASRSRTVNSPMHCAYNQTRECFLGLEVTALDAPREDLAKAINTLAIQSGEGVWIAPFRGIPPARSLTPFDLVYLDDACRVLDLVEAFPTLPFNSSNPQPASVLVLPAHSIYSSQTELGDQVSVCATEEMVRRFELMAETGVPTNMESALPLPENPFSTEDRGLAEAETPASRAGNGRPEGQETPFLTPSSTRPHKLRNWLERWFWPDPRKAPRRPASGLAAYYWTGAAPLPHWVRDVSSSGLYLVTGERWYPGTLVLMTLQRTECKEEAVERSVAVQSRAVRWGPDGVGLQLELPNATDLRLGRHPLLDGVSKKEFEHFLDQLDRNQ